MAIAELDRRLALDVSKEDPDDPRNFDAFLIEHRVGPYHERIGHIQISLGELRKIAETHETVTLKDTLEKMAILNIISWGEQQSQQGEESKQFALWPSPPGDGYRESRFVLYENLGAEQLTVTIIPSDTSLIEIQQGVAQLTGQEYKKDEIRANIFPFIPSEGEHWVETLSRYFRLPPFVVETIKQGKHVQSVAKAGIVGREILAENRHLFGLAKTQRDWLELGRRLEQMAAERGYALQWVGSCGMSNSAALSILDKMVQAGSTFNIIGQKSMTPEWTSGTCSMCGERALVCCTICKKCAAKL